jgi:hypothetical protein
MPSARAVRIRYDRALFQPSVEEIRIEDYRLRGTWGDRLYWILLRAGSPPVRAKWNVVFSR